MRTLEGYQNMKRLGELIASRWYMRFTILFVLWFTIVYIMFGQTFCSYGQVSCPDTMEAWVKDKFGIEVPRLEISQDWKTYTLVDNCKGLGTVEYQWYVRWNDARFQVKDKDENFYRLYYLDQTLYLDYKRDFVINKWEF